MVNLTADDNAVSPRGTRYESEIRQMTQRGAGAPPPRKGGGGDNNQPIYYLSEPITTSSGPQLKMVKALKLRAGTKNQPILTLDDIGSLNDGYSINIHMFNLRGTKDNIVVCPKTEKDPRPCPVCEVLNKDPSWYVVLSAIDRQKYTFDRKDKNTGVMGKVTYTDLRRLVLVTQTWTQRMTTNAREKSFRGALFEVSRSEPIETMENGQKKVNWKDSPRIGDVWYRSETYDEEKLKAEFEKRAADYGTPVERFIRAFDYDVLLKPKTHQELTHVANDIKGDTSAVKDSDAPADKATNATATVSSTVIAGAAKTAGDPASSISY